MSFVDASVIVAILNEEPGFEELEKRLADSKTQLHISPMVRFEAVAALAMLHLPAHVAAANRGALIAEARRLVDDFVQAVGAKEIAIDTGIGLAALDAMTRYGKVAGRAAALNFGDCFAYAVARIHRLALIYKGNDFALTDIA